MGSIDVPSTETPARFSIRLDPARTGRDAGALREGLRRMIVGQDEAIQRIVKIYQMHLTGMKPPGRPIGNFLFLSPTGSGNTRIVEATAEVLLKNPRALVKIDCAEFQHRHEIAKLIGSPPGRCAAAIGSGSISTSEAAGCVSAGRAKAWGWTI